MAADFLRTHGIDLDAELAQIQSNTPWTGTMNMSSSSGTRTVSQIQNVSLPVTEPSTRWNVSIDSSKGTVSSISPYDASQTSSANKPACMNGHGALLAPSLCHPHIHLDKAFLLSHPKYATLQVEKGDFGEAMDLTGKAKAQFEHADLLERGQRVIDESVVAGVTHMRCFVEVDAGVGLKCLEAGIALKIKAQGEGRCRVQLCAFAQLPLFSPSSGDPDGAVVKDLMQQAAQREEVEVLGSTPYVESSREKAKSNVEWLVRLAAQHSKHLDFHLDYTLDADTEPMVWHVLRELRFRDWGQRKTKGKTVVLGHCTRLTLFRDIEWTMLKEEIGDLPVSFVGLPTSDLFMMGREDAAKPRGTLDVPDLIKNRGLNACIGINNIGNAFTPHGSCDPLTLACNGIGIYQAGTKADAELLYECVSTRARKAIGMAEVHDGEDAASLKIEEGMRADLVLFGAEKEEWRTRRSVAEAVYLYDSCRGRRGTIGGVLTAEDDT